MADSTDPQFYKFPKTPHVAGSSTVDDDEVLPASQLSSAGTTFPGAERVVIQEKVDGANVGVHFEEQWSPLIQKRGGLVATNEKPQYSVFRDWVFARLELLWDILGSKYVLFGEWLWNKHAIGYDKLPDYLVVFDVFDKVTKEFLAFARVEALIANRLPLVPLLNSITLATPAKPATAKAKAPAGVGSTGHQDIYKAVTQLLLRPSHFGTEQQEGV